MKVAIRDDDTSYFTKPKDLQRAYDFLNEDDCVSLSVVPYTVPVHRDDVFPYGKEIGMGYYDIAENTELLEYLKKKYINKVTIEDIGLYYIGIPNSEESGYVLTPFWFFCVSSEAWNAEEKTEMPTNVFYELLNATNGEWLYH